jgi:hypothetical protein
MKSQSKFKRTNRRPQARTGGSGKAVAEARFCEPFSTCICFVGCLLHDPAEAAVTLDSPGQLHVLQAVIELAVAGCSAAACGTDRAMRVPRSKSTINKRRRRKYGSWASDSSALQALERNISQARDGR